MNNKKRIIAIILSLLMVFSNIINIFGIYDTDFSSGIDSQVIINGDSNINSNINNNIDIDNTDSKTNNIIKEQENKSNIEEENTLTENGRIIKAKI